MNSRVSLRSALKVCALSLSLLAATASSQGAEAPGVTWTSWAAALTKAKQENKPVMLDFYATWCGPCKMMDKQTYTDPAVQKEMGNWINVKIDVDKLPAIAKKNDISSIPTTILLDASGKKIAREVGFIDPKQFVAFLEKNRPKK